MKSARSASGKKTAFVASESSLPGLKSRIMCVPAAVPSETNGSQPAFGSQARKNNRLPAAVSDVAFVYLLSDIEDLPSVV